MQAVSKIRGRKEMSSGKKIGIGCLGLVVIVIAIIIFSGSGNKSSSGGTSPDATNSGSQKSEYAVGEIVKLKNHELVVTDVKQGYTSSNMFDKPRSADNEFVVVTVQITNTGSDQIDANSFGFKLEDETGTQRNGTIVAGVDGELQSVTLSPGGKTAGKLAFEAKKGSSTLKLHYSPGLFGGDSVIIKLK